LGDLIKKEIGKTAQEYIQSKLIDVAKEKVFDGSKTINQIAYDLSFKYAQHFPVYKMELSGLLIKEILTLIAPIPFPKIGLGGFAVLCYTSNRRSQYHLLYDAGRHGPTPMLDLPDDRPVHALDANRLYHHTKDFSTAQRTR
jgi:AraC-like DNA-binding protein